MKTSNAMVHMVMAGVLMAIAAPVAAQQAYPNKPIRFIVPYAAGGGTDTVTRLLAPKMTESMGQPVIVDNRPGGNTIIGTDALAKSPADGYTILFMGTSHVVNASLLTTPYDAIRDFAPVANVSSFGLILVLPPSMPVNNLQELIALAEARPGQLNYASTGTGGSQHLTGELFSIVAGIKVQHIPYKGGAPAFTDLLGGQVQMMFAVPTVSTQYIKSGRLKAIAICSESRSSAVPQVPTFTEAGLPGLDLKNWYGILATAGTPKAIIDKLSTEIAKILALPDVKEKLLSMGLEPFYSTPEQFAVLMKADVAKYAKIIKTANIKLEK